MLLVTLFIVNFLIVFLLGFQSQLVRDGNKMLSFITSNIISVCQFYFIANVSIVGASILPMLSTALGASTGIVFSIITYEWFIKNKKGA